MIKSLFLKYKELIMYVIFGGATTVVNYGAYYLLRLAFGEEYAMALTGAAWLISVLFAFVTNKIWVFESKSWQMGVVTKEMTAFLSARLASLGLELAIMYIFVEILGYNDLVIKLLANIFVVVANYALSKLWIFR